MGRCCKTLTYLTIDMLVVGPLFLISGVLPTAFNKHLTRAVFGRKPLNGSFKHSVSRQNCAIIGIVLILSGLAMIYIGIRG